MKKLIAIMLSVMMLVSCFSMSISAVRNYEKATEEVTAYWQFPEGESYNPIEVGNQAGQDVELDIRFDLDRAGIKSNWTSLGSKATVICLDGTVGVGDTTVSGAGFVTGKWYHVLFDVDATANSTAIYVDGVLRTTVADIPSYYSDSQAFWQWDKISIDNLKIGTYFEDFEGFDETSSFGTSGQGHYVPATEATYNNHNDYFKLNGNKCYQWQTGSYWYMDEFVSDASNGYMVQLRVRLDEASSEIKSINGGGLVVTRTKIGVGSKTQPVNLEIGKWYMILFNSIAGTGTGIVIWDENLNILTQCAVAETLVARPCMNATLVSIDDLFIKDKNSNILWSEDFNSGTFAKVGDSNGVIIDDGDKISKDLGMKYWKFAEGQSYNPIAVGNQAGQDIELDIKFDLAGAGIKSAWTSSAKAPVICLDGTVGVGDTTVKSTVALKKDVWYHVLFDVDSANNKTTIYIDGYPAGTVSDVPTYYENSQTLWQWDKVSIDNLTVGTYSENFENATTFGTSGQGALTVYDFPTEAETLFANITAEKELSGEAYLIEAANKTQYAFFGQNPNCLINPNGSNFILSFSLALLPATAYGETESDPYIEFWLNKNCQRRIRIGTTFAGMQLDNDTSDFLGYKWGDATLDNNHNVTIVFNNGSDKTSLYIDGIFIWEGPAGVEWTDRLIGTVTNGSAVLDNIHIYDLKYNEKTVNVVTGEGSEYRAVNVDAEDFCATNGHIVGDTTKTHQETCYEKGIITTVCAICGEDHFSSEIDTLEHNWNSYPRYNTSKSATATTDGIAYWTCSNSGCTDRIEGNRILATDKYTGEIYADFDFENGEVMNTIQKGAMFTEANNYSFTGGVLNIDDSCDSAYHQFSDLRNTNRGFTASFDFKYGHTYDTGDTGKSLESGGYGHSLYFWFGGSSGIANKAGIDFDNNRAFIMSDSKAFSTVAAPVSLNDGEWHNIVFRCRTTTDAEFDAEDYGYATIEIDGQVVASIEGEDAYWYLGDNMGYIIMRNFGINCQIDNLIIGSPDLTLNLDDVAVAGDINGDGRTTVLDLLILRKVVACGNNYGLDLTTADVNGDGLINAADVLAVRTILKH